MKKITFFCLVFLCLFSAQSFAQAKFGVKVGVNSTRIGVNYNDSDDEKAYKDALKSKLGLTLGLAAEFGFSDALSLQSGLMLANKGYKLEMEEDGESIKAKTSVNYLEIPLNLAYNMGGFQVHAGPYLGFGLFGKSKTEYNFGGESESDEEKFKFKNSVKESDFDDLKEDEDFMRRLDYGLNLGVGYRVGPALINATYAWGLANTIPKYEGEDDDDEKLTNKGVSLGVTFFFNK
jgi:hypothetical protein